MLLLGNCYWAMQDILGMCLVYIGETVSTAAMIILLQQLRCKTCGGCANAGL
jgi:hypothetical protein